MQAVQTFVPRAGVRIRRVDMRVVVGVVLMVVAIAGTSGLVQKAQNRTPVLVAAKTVQPGEIIKSSDLRTASMSVPAGVASVAGSSLSGIVGQVAAEPLWPGKLLSPQSVAKSSSLPAGYVAMSVALKPDRAAGGALRSGDRVAVIASTSPDRPEAKTTILLTDVPVLSSREARTSEGSGVIVLLRLRLEEARAIAEAQAAGSIDLVLLARVAK